MSSASLHYSVFIEGFGFLFVEMVGNGKRV